MPSRRKLPKTISEKQFLAIMKKVPKEDKKLRLAFMLGFYQCMRVSEIVKLKKEDVDLDRNFIHILEAKGGKDRDVPIMAPVRKGLKYLPITGLGYSIRALQRKIDKYSMKALGHGFFMHGLRSSGSTFYLNDKGVSIRHIQDLLGHSRIDTTMLYTKVTPRHLKKAFESVWEEK